MTTIEVNGVATTRVRLVQAVALRQTQPFTTQELAEYVGRRFLPVTYSLTWVALDRLRRAGRLRSLPREQGPVNGCHPWEVVS